ncbi:MAG TPA: P-II family nitrogen regulator [Candidatus Dormibacteraeota bacterium]|jgi:nitrogen regulatory protein P-II 1|nr:P-II family nitrogen regulator [Candidatus Dormibacteraeota bacterium]
MRKIEAIIRPEKLQAVQDALDGLGASGLTVTEVLGCGAQRGYTEMYRGTRANISLQRKVKIEVVVPQVRADGVVEAIQKAAHTGEVGDGKIFVTVVEQAIRIRTGEKGDEIVQHRIPEHWGH